MRASGSTRLAPLWPAQAVGYAQRAKASQQARLVNLPRTFW